MQIHRENIKKHSGGGVVIFALIFVIALSFCRVGGAVQAQGFVTPTPLPAAVATQTAADATLSNITAQNDQAAQLEAQAAEIRRNAAAQTQQAAQAYADARAATAAQNAAAIGEAIGRGEAALAQLKDSADGALSINATQAAIVNSLYISVTQLSADLSQARIELANVKIINAGLLKNNQTLTAQNTAQAKSADVLGTLPLYLGFSFLVLLVVFVIWKWQHTPAQPVAQPATGTAQTQSEEPAEPIIDGDIEQT